jgi:hypothetical protein
MRNCSVDRLMPGRAAAPLGPETVPPVSNHRNGNLRATLENAERQEIVAVLAETNGKDSPLDDVL